MAILKQIFRYSLLFIYMFFTYLLCITDMGIYIPSSIYDEILCEVYGQVHFCWSLYVIQGLSFGILIIIFFKVVSYQYNLYIVYFFYTSILLLDYPNFEIDKLLIMSIFFSSTLYLVCLVFSSKIRCNLILSSRLN